MSNMKSEEDVSQKVIEREDESKKVIEREDDLSNLISKGIAAGDVRSEEDVSQKVIEREDESKKVIREARVDKKELVKSTTADSEKEEKKKRKVTEEISEVNKKNKKFKWVYVTTLNEVHKAHEGGHLDLVFMLKEQKESPKIKFFCESLGISLVAVHGEVKELTSSDQFESEYLTGYGRGPEKYHYVVESTRDDLIFSLLRGHQLKYTEI